VKNFSRREFLAGTMTAATAAMLPFEAPADEVSKEDSAKSKRPNILWLSTEDLSPDLGCCGDKYAVTPNIDRFAAGAMRYTNALGCRCPRDVRMGGNGESVTRYG
jgi:hypothetical protein